MQIGREMMVTRMTEKVQISFEASHGDDTSPFVVILNPGVLPSALFSQVKRFGLVGAADRKAILSGRLKGNRTAFTQMIESYGVGIEIVHSPQNGAV